MHHLNLFTLMCGVYPWLLPKVDLVIMFCYDKTHYNDIIKCFCYDLGGEYTYKKLYDLFAYDCIITSCTNTPQKNGVVERKHRHTIETDCFLLLYASIPNEFWGEAVINVVHAINRIS